MTSTGCRRPGPTSSLRLSPDPSQLHQQAAVLHDVDAGAGEALGGGGVADSELEPDRPWALGDDVVHVGGDVAGAAEDVHHVHRALDLGDGAVDALAEDLGGLRVVDR